MNTAAYKRIAALEAKEPSPEHDEKAFASMRALWDGMKRDAVPDPVNYCKPSVYKLAAALLARITSDTLTDRDIEMLAGVPECKYPVVVLLKLTADLQTR